MYPIAHGVRHLDAYLNGPATLEHRGLNETFLSEVARDMYSALSRLGIRDPVLTRVLDDVRARTEREDLAQK